MFCQSQFANHVFPKTFFHCHFANHILPKVFANLILAITFCQLWCTTIRPKQGSIMILRHKFWVNCRDGKTPTGLEQLAVSMELFAVKSDTKYQLETLIFTCDADLHLCTSNKCPWMRIENLSFVKLHPSVKAYKVNRAETAHKPKSVAEKLRLRRI